jgi:hypothetical protein
MNDDKFIRFDRAFKSNAGRKPRFREPKEVWDCFLQYYDQCAAMPIAVGSKKQASRKNTKKNGEETAAKNVNETAPRPMTLYGFCAFANIPEWHTYKDNYKHKRGFPEINERIELIIKSQQVEGAMVGLYNSNLTARLNGIADRQDVTTNGKELSTTQMSDEELLQKAEEIRRKTEHLNEIGFKQQCRERK